MFAGGDIVTVAASVIQAMGARRRTVAAMKFRLGIAHRQERDLSDGDRPRAFGIDERQRPFRRIRVA